MIPTDPHAVTITRHLPVKLDQYRERFLHTEQTEGRMEELRLTEHLKNVNDSVKQLIKDQQKRQTDAARALHAGFEHQPVSCRQELDLAKNTLTTYRVDNGEKVDERALSAEEVKAHKTKGAAQENRAGTAAAASASVSRLSSTTVRAASGREETLEKP